MENEMDSAQTFLSLQSLLAGGCIGQNVHFQKSNNTKLLLSTRISLPPVIRRFASRKPPASQMSKRENPPKRASFIFEKI